MIAPLAIVLGTLVSYALGGAIGRPLVVPVLNTAASFPFMVAALRRGDLRLAGLNEDLQTLFELTKLATLFSITRTPEEALAAF